MLTLVLTVLTTAYFVGPDFLARYIMGAFMVPRATTTSKGEEITRGAVWALLPLAFAWWTRFHWFFGIYRMPAKAAQSASVVFAGLFNDKVFEKTADTFAASIPILIRANASLLFREYAVIAILSGAFAVTVRNFGSIKHRLRNINWLWKLIRWIILPKISEWHIVLSPMLLQNKGRSRIAIDVLTKSGILYRGEAYEKMVGADGSLQTLILEYAHRYLRDDFSEARRAWSDCALPKETQKPRTEDFWRPIPGKLFVIVGSDVCSVNVRHESAPAALAKEKKADEAYKAVLADLGVFIASHDRSRLSLSPKPGTPPGELVP